MNAAALKHLAAIDPVMATLIREIGICKLKPETRRSPFQSLVQAVAHQQLNGTTAKVYFSFSNEPIDTRRQGLFNRERTRSLGADRSAVKNVSCLHRKNLCFCTAGRINIAIGF